MTTPKTRARLNVEALIASALERVPLPELARRIEGIALDASHRLRASIETTAWHHPGARSLIAELADRLLTPSDVGGDEWQTRAGGGAVAAGWEMGYRPETAGERPLTDELVAVNDKLAAIARGAGVSTFLTSKDLGLIAFALGDAARGDEQRSTVESLLEDIEVWAHSSGTFPGVLLAGVRRYLGPKRCGACSGGAGCLVHPKREGGA